MIICRNCAFNSIISFALLLSQGFCYEKTLRKIVRNQSKMVQRPFSDTGEIAWRNTSLSHDTKSHDPSTYPGYAQVKTLFHNMQRPKISTILSSIESGGSKSTYSKIKIARNDNINPNELRLTRNTLAHLTKAVPSSTNNYLFLDFNNKEKYANETDGNVKINTFYQIPSQTKFFPIVEDQVLQNVDSNSSKEITITIPDNKNILKENNSIFVKSIFIANPETKISNENLPTQNTYPLDNESEKPDFVIEEIAKSPYGYNVSTNPYYVCKILKDSKTDINAQEKFADFDIEPTWMSSKKFWNHIFDSRYDSLMRNPKWPPLKVILVPRTHVDTIWKRSFNQYHNETVNKILANIIKKLQYYNNLTFNWNEVSHLSEWWKTATQKSRSAMRRLVKRGRLEITTGGWVEPDEATTHLFGLVHQLIEGHQWLENHLDYIPKVAWLTNSVTHSPSMAYFLSAAGISNLVFTNLHFVWQKYLAEYQYSDFLWYQNWDSDISTTTTLNNALNKIGVDRDPKHTVFAHYMPFNSAGFKACGPNADLCNSEFNFAKSNKNIDINSYNVKEKSELLLEQYSKTGTLSPHNIIIAPIGDAYSYEYQSEFDYQYNNYQKIAEYVNVNREIYKATIEFGTASNYFNAVFDKQKVYPTLKGDFLNFADIITGKPAYWAGFFTSRPSIKILLRRLQSTLRTTEIIFTFAVSLNSFQGINMSQLLELLSQARQNVARLLDRNVVSGTLIANAVKYVHDQILTTAKDCWYIQEITASLLSSKPGKQIPYLQKYVYRDGEFISGFRTVSPGDQIYIFNSLSQERTEVVELITRFPNIRIVDHHKKDVTIQINPVWKYGSNNIIKISRRFFKILFVIVVPPLTFELFKIKDTYDGSQNSATLYCLACVIDEVTSNGSIFPFIIQPIEIGDIQLESYKHRLIFDEFTGFLKSVVQKETNKERTVIIDYGAFRSSDINSGMFLFNTNVTKPLHDILTSYRTGEGTKIVMITSGQVTTELTSVYGKLLQHNVKIFNLVNSPLSSAIYIESKVDYELSPKNRELELFMSVHTDISNGNPPLIFTDNNGFQFTARTININKRIESNMYPLTSMAYIQDRRSRLTFITDHAQGVTALQEGQLVIMLDRRVLYNDGRGTNEGLADSGATWHRHVILLENVIEPSKSPHEPFILQMPSLSAIYLMNSLNYLLDIFIIDKNQSDLCHYAFLPLIKTSFPCDISLVNYRLNLKKKTMAKQVLNSALMILHRHSTSCQVDHSIHFQCNDEGSFNLDDILRNIKAVYQTNLCGTNRGTRVSHINIANFPAMELKTLRINF